MFRSRVRALGALVAVGLMGALMAPANAAGTQNIFHVWAVDVTDPGCWLYHGEVPGDVAVAKGATYFTSWCAGTDPDHTYHTELAKVDAAGKTVWSKHIPGNSSGSQQSITAGDFGVVFAQTYTDATTGSLFTRITRYGPGGARIWQMELPLLIKDVKVVNGQLFAGGGKLPNGPMYVARLDLATGAVQAEKSYSVNEFGYSGGAVVRMAELRGTLVLAVEIVTTNKPEGPWISLVRRIGPGLKVWWTKKSFNDRITGLDASDDQIFTTGTQGMEVLNPDGSTVRRAPGEALGAKVAATPGGPVTITNQYVTSYNLDGTQRWQLRTTYDRGGNAIWGADWNYQGIRILEYKDFWDNNKQRIKLLKITKNDACPC